MRKFYVLLAPLCCLAFLTGCQPFDEFEDIDQVRYDAEFAIPLIDTELSIRELLEGVEEATSILIDNDGVIRFLYQGEVIKQTSADLFASINKSLPPIIPVNSPRMALPFVTPDGVEVDRVDLKSGRLTYYIENKHPDRVAVTISLPQVTKNGIPMSFKHNLPGYSGTGTAPSYTNILAPASLVGHSIVSQKDSIYIEYEALRSDGSRDTLSRFLLNIQDFGFTYAEGYLGNQVYDGVRDTIAIDFFDNWVQGNIYFEEPRITVFVENSFGVPTRSIVNLFNVITVHGEVLPLEGEGISEGIDFPFPSIDEVGKVETFTYTFTKSNSNIDRLLGAGPVAVDYDVDALTNPDQDKDIRGFVTDSSYYRVRLDVELPLYGRASDFVALDTFDLDFTSYEDAESAEFKLVADNQLPLDVDIQGYFLDENGAVVDSLLDVRQRVVAAAPVNGQGIASGVVQKTTFAPFEGERFDNIRQARRLLLSAAFSTVQDGKISVRPLAEQQVRIRIGVKLNVERE